MRRYQTAAGLLALLAVAPAAYGWGVVGHEIIARIAEHRLTPQARGEVRRLLGEEVELASVAAWADAVRPERPETAPWHYVNISPPASALDMDRDCPDGACVVGAVERFAREFGDTTLPQPSRAEALRYLIHFVGDLHQPLHCYAPGRGGNDISVLCADRPQNLHEIWDTVLIERQGLTSAEYAADLLVDIDAANVPGWVRSGPRDWAVESWLLALGSAAATPSGRPIVSGDALGRLYMDGATVVVDQQLTRAGVRLAWMINSALQGAATSRPARSTGPGEHPDDRRQGIQSAPTSLPSP